MIKTDSDHIANIVNWLERCGVKVHQHAFDLPAAGMYRSETREIFLNESNAFIALLTLAHEAGHWLGWLIDPKEHSYQRERQAYVYGWYVLQWFETYVTRDTWRMFCQECWNMHKQGVPSTEQLYR